jgi:hypothetical protein
MRHKFLVTRMGRRRGAGILWLIVCVALVSCSHSESVERLNVARASASAMDPLLKRMGSIQAIETRTDSLDAVGHALEAAVDTSTSILTVRVLVTDSRRIQSRQIALLRENAAYRSADYAAAKTHLGALAASLDSVPRQKPEVASILRAFLTWPLVGLLLLFLVFKYPDRLHTILGRVRSIRLFSSEVVLSEQTTSAAEETFESLRKQAKQRYSLASNKVRLDHTFLEMMNQHIRPLLAPVLNNDSSLRSTIYIPDILFQKHLAQVVDYWPRGGGRGRAYPVYFGMIGKAWRLRESRIEGHVTTDVKNLVLEWGMTQEEAVAKGKDRESFAAVVLKTDTTTVGILYMDCKTPSAFGEEAADQVAFEDRVLEICKSVNLIGTLAEFHKELSSGSMPIDLQLEP